MLCSCFQIFSHVGLCQTKNTIQKYELPRLGVAINFVAPIEEDGVCIIQFHDEEVEDKVRRWKKALIVCVLGARLPF